MSSEGIKYDAGKPDMSLLTNLSRAMLMIGEILTYGANKYDRDNYEKVEGWDNRYLAAKLRHDFLEGQEFLDPESGKPHAAHSAVNSIIRLELLLREQEITNQEEEIPNDV